MNHLIYTQTCFAYPQNAEIEGVEQVRGPDGQDAISISGSPYGVVTEEASRAAGERHARQAPRQSRPGEDKSALAWACTRCGAKGALKICTRCRSARYCGRECQLAAWPSHKQACAALCAATAAAPAAATAGVAAAAVKCSAAKVGASTSGGAGPGAAGAAASGKEAEESWRAEADRWTVRLPHFHLISRVFPSDILDRRSRSPTNLLEVCGVR